MNTRSFLLAAAFAAFAVPAHADPKLLGTFTSWSAYTNGTGGNLTCYALAKPQSSEPAKAKRDRSSSSSPTGRHAGRKG